MSYSRIHIFFHWATVGLIVLMACTGLAYSYELLDKSVINAHQLLGQLFILIMVGRIATRVFIPPTPCAKQHPKWEMWLANGVQLALYIVLIAYLASGYVSASAFRDPNLILPANQAFARSDMGEQILEIHFMLKWVLLGLVSLHIAGALKHHFIDRDDTVSHIIKPQK